MSRSVLVRFSWVLETDELLKCDRERNGCAGVVAWVMVTFVFFSLLLFKKFFLGVITHMETPLVMNLLFHIVDGLLHH